jgi:hypothetical protein
MLSMQRHLSLAAGLVAMLAAAACQSKKSSDDALSRELDSASGSSGLLPMAGGTDVVSAIERSPTAKKNPVVAHPQSAQRTTQKAPQPTTTVAEQAPDPAPAEPTPAPIGTATPAQSPNSGVALPRPESGNHYPNPARHPQPRRGGYPSTGDIIRRAPFPINP